MSKRRAVKVSKEDGLIAELTARLYALTNAITIIEDDEEMQSGDYYINTERKVAEYYRQGVQVYLPKRFNKIIQRNGKPVVYRSELEKTND